MADGLKQNENGDTNNAMKACCADLMDYVR